MVTKSKNKSGRSTLPEDMQRVQRTITLSPEADKVVTLAISARGPYFNNRSRFIESRILPTTK